MASYNDFFATWKATESPPVQTPEYLEVKNKYDNWFDFTSYSARPAKNQNEEVIS